MKIFIHIGVLVISNFLLNMAFPSLILLITNLTKFIQSNPKSTPETSCLQFI